MFTRSLTRKELDFLEKIGDFVREKHAKCERHDYSHSSPGGKKTLLEI